MVEVGSVNGVLKCSGGGGMLAVGRTNSEEEDVCDGCSFRSNILILVVVVVDN